MAFSYLNASYSVFAYGASRYAGFPVSPPPPAAVSVELSSRCNLSCPECVTGSGLINRKDGFISYDLVSMIVPRLRDHVLSAWLSFQGEPMMHPDFFRIANLFAGMNPVISTNGHWLDRENCIRLAASPLRKIIVSYDGATPETYRIYRRGGDHVLVTEGVRRLAETIRERRSGQKLVLQFLVHRGNEHESRDVAAFARSVGAEFRIKSMQVLDQARAGEWAPSAHRRSRYRKDDAGNWCADGTSRRGCLRMWTSAVITTDGDVVPCCYDKYGDHVMGNLGEGSFIDIWTGDRYRSFRGKVMGDRRLVDICSRCPQGSQLFFRR